MSHFGFLSPEVCKAVPPGDLYQLRGNLKSALRLIVEVHPGVVATKCSKPIHYTVNLWGAKLTLIIPPKGLATKCIDVEAEYVSLE